jgi:hypothetical protein
MPKNVRRFAWLWWTSILIGVCEIPFSSPTDPNLTKAGFSQASQIEFELIGTAVVIAILLPFYWLAVSRRKNWARWVLFIFFVAVAIASLFATMPTVHNRIAIVMDYVSWLALAAAFFFLFTGDAPGESHMGLFGLRDD